MASVHADFDSSTATTPGTPTASPIHCPTWSAPHISYLSLSPSPLGPRAAWTSRVSTHRTLSTPSSPVSPSPALAFFPPSAADLPQTLHALQALKARAHAPSFCAVADPFLTVSTPAADHLHIALPTNRPVTRLLPLLSGLLLEVAPQPAESPDYYFLPRPLDPMARLAFPHRGHRLVHASLDLPLIVSRNRSSLVVWAAREVVRPAYPTAAAAAAAPVSVDPDVAHSDPIAAFVRSAADSAMSDTAQHPASVLADHPSLAVRHLALRQLFSAPVEENAHISAFLAHDLRGRLVLCVCAAGELTGLSFALDGLDVVDMAPSFRIRDVASAVAVLAVRRGQNCLDILVRRASGHMSLFMGRNKLCSVQLKNPPAGVSGLAVESMGAVGTELAVANAVADQFSLVDKKGRGRRYSMRAVAFSSPLVNACLGAVSFVFETAGIMLRMTTLYHDILTVGSRRREERMGEVDGEWAVFEQVLLQAGSEAMMNINRMDTDYDAGSGGEENAVNGEAAWTMLLRSEYHAVYSEWKFLGPPPLSPSAPSQVQSEFGEVKASDAETLKHVLHALHLVYEDQKLRPLMQGATRRLAYLNVRLARLVGSGRHVDLYRRDYGSMGLFQDDLLPLGGADYPAVPSIMDQLRDIVNCRTGRLQPYPVLLPTQLMQTQCLPLTALWRARSPADMSAKMMRYYECLYSPDERNLSYAKRAECLLLTMVGDGFSRLELEVLPFGVALPLQDALLACRERPKQSWPYGAFALIGRGDLYNCSDADRAYMAIKDKEQQMIDDGKAVLQIQAAAASIMQTAESGLVSKSVAESMTQKEELDTSGGGGNLDGCDMRGHLVQLRFSTDRRAEEVRRILRSTDPIVMTVPDIPHVDPNADFDINLEQKHKLEMLLQKRFATPVGRGAFSLRTYIPSDPTKSLSVPAICTSGILYGQKGSKVTIPPHELTRFDWGRFHNGVAAGLRILAAEDDRDSDSGQILTRSWIVNHRPTDDSGSASHAGMLLAFGLGGYLPALRTTDYYEYLVPRHDLTSIGLMLGLASGNLGSTHEKITKMLCVHIRYFNSPGFAVPDFHVPSNVQTAAILGLGLLHMGSCEHLIIDGLFAELSHRPQPGGNVDNREALALAAGVSIGLLCLGSGLAAFDAADSRLVDKLILFANGGPNDTISTASNHFRSASVKQDITSRQDRANPTLVDSEASRVKESNFVNIDVVSPGALLALAFVYLKTNDKRIADRITLPTTLYSLDRARPDHVFLRALTRMLIMWDDIAASEEWIISTLPPLLRPSVSGGDSSYKEYDANDLPSKIDIGAIYLEHDVDVAGILEARAFATAAACTAMALKYAGTNDAKAVSVLFTKCVAFERTLLSEQKKSGGVTWVPMTCLSSAALALSIVASGSGDLEIFRLLRRLRKRGGKLEHDQRYGYHLAMHMAIGFLFLGGGCQTFGSSNIAIVGLVCAVYPRFPEDVADNQFHLQAMRHLYVLAAEPRCIETRDVDTGVPCCVNVEVLLNNGSVMQQKAPCIVPDANQIKSISVVSERYWRTTVSPNPAIPGMGWYSSTKFQVLFVKRKTGHLPYSSDPKGCKGIIARSLRQPQAGTANTSDYFSRVDHLVRAFSADPDVLSFVKYFCSPSGAVVGVNGSSGADGKARRHVQMLFECLSEDKPEAVRVYMNSERALMGILAGSADPSIVGSLMVAHSYVSSGRMPSVSMLQPTYLTKLMLKVHDALNYVELSKALRDYVRSAGRRWPSNAADGERCRSLASDLGVLLRLVCTPAPGKLGDLSAALKRAESASVETVEKWLFFSDASVGSTSMLTVERIMTALSETKD